MRPDPLQCLLAVLDLPFELRVVQLAQQSAERWAWLMPQGHEVATVEQRWRKQDLVLKFASLLQ